MRVVILVLAVLLLPGCVYLRLLEVRNQLRDFDAEIEVAGAPGLEVRFRHPVLLDTDLDHLIGAGPTAAARFPGGEVRTYAFSRLPTTLGEDLPGAATILVLTAVLDDGRLRAVAFPDEVFQVIPRDLAVAALRAMGSAQVDTASRSASTQVGVVPQAVPPDGARLVEALGHPNVRQDLPDGRRRWVWRYVLDQDGDQPVMAAMAFVFPAAGGPANQFQANITGMWLYLHLGQ
jgi:hypothetical protein